MGKKVLIAMSGGVDSSVAAYLMKQQGYDCIGAAMNLFAGSCADIGINTAGDIEDARSVAGKLGMPFHVIDLSGEFEKQVINRFVDVYQNGATPNPCVVCNRHIKFGALFQKATELGADYIATGHYAVSLYDDVRGRQLLKKARDGTKDQSYVLYSLKQEQLRCAMFPLGNFTKSEVRAIAAGQGFINAGRRESQDICFVPDGDYAGFIERRIGRKYESGDFIDMQGNVLGRHRGQIRYTIGQRKGLGLSFHEPMYVHSKDARSNTVTVCGNEGLLSKTLEALDFNWIAYDGAALPHHSPIRAKAKVRYKQSEQWATVYPASFDSVRLEFDEPQRAIAPGQAVVLYDGDVVVGGGTIV